MRAAFNRHISLLLATALGLAVVSFAHVGMSDTVAAQAVAAAIPNIAGKVMTVLGPIEPVRLGHTLTHEHIFVNLTLPDDEPERWALVNRPKPATPDEIALYNTPLSPAILGTVQHGAYNRDNMIMSDEAIALEEVRKFQRKGGGTIVEVTSIGFNRSPEKLKRVAQASGVNIIMGGSWYQKAWHPRGLEKRTVEDLTAEIVRDITVGVDGTGIRTGIIGEVGTVGGPLVPTEINVIKASGRASRMTGAAVSLHTAASRRAQMEILDLLAAEGADLHRVVVGHSDPAAGDMPLMKQILDRGAYVQFDLLGRPIRITSNGRPDADLAKSIVDLIAAGYIDQILLSHDVCWKQHLTAYGGTGYTYREEYFLPYLKRLGVTDTQIEKIVVANPTRMLTFAAPR